MYVYINENIHHINENIHHKIVIKILSRVFFIFLIKSYHINYICNEVSFIFHHLIVRLLPGEAGRNPQGGTSLKFWA